MILDEATSSIDVRSELMVQAALDKVSKDRTTITIAHRLSTIKKADNILVLRKGQVVQQGTHESLMAKEGGPYWTLATAQQLMTGPEEEEEDVPAARSDLSEKKSWDVIETKENASGDTSTMDTAESVPVKAKPMGLIGSFALLLREQKARWPWYLLLFIGTIGGGGRTDLSYPLFFFPLFQATLSATVEIVNTQTATAPLHAYLFAHLLTLFRIWGEELLYMSRFWCLMFAMLAIMVGLSYFAMGWSATTLAIVSVPAFRAAELCFLVATTF